jgi:hypothetical protein
MKGTCFNLGCQTPAFAAPIPVSLIIGLAVSYLALRKSKTRDSIDVGVCFA